MTITRCLYITSIASSVPKVKEFIGIMWLNKAVINSANDINTHFLAN